MPQTPQQLGIAAPSGGFDSGGFYKGREFVDGTFGDPGKFHVNSPTGRGGQSISSDVIGQTNPEDVGFINSQISADSIKQTPSLNLPSGSATGASTVNLQDSVSIARNNLQSTLETKQKTIDAEMAVLKEREKETLEKVGELSTPFRAELEEKERERLHINKNFEANQALTDELDQLLTEGNELIEQQKNVTGLSAVRNPRIQKAMNDVAARAGVIQAVMGARNGQIGQANNMIDRTMRAITSDRSDQITYYETILNLNNRDILSLDSDSKKVAEDQLNLVKGDLSRAQATQDYIKQLMIDPSTAGLMGEAGVSLTDSVEVINSKMAQAEYAREVKDTSNGIGLQGGVSVSSPVGVPAAQLITQVDSRGNTRYYKMPPKSTPGGSSAFTENFIKDILGVDSIPNQTTPITGNEYADILSIVDDVVAPAISPAAGVGSTFVDSFNRKWVFQSSGWQLIG